LEQKRLTEDEMVTSVESIVREHVGAASELADSVRLQDDLEIDSLELVELGGRLEKVFGVDLPFDRLSACTTLADLARFVHRSRRFADAAG
jgi:acyl carrier protein